MRAVLVLVLAFTCCGCVSSARTTPHVSLPVFTGWHAGERVYYITTEITDAGMARAGGITYAPRLIDAVPEYPKPPEVRTVLERVYKFPGGGQDAVFASAPRPVGPSSTDAAYSPLWLVMLVRWIGPDHHHALKSEEEVLAAKDRGEVSIEQTSIVINCPIVATRSGGALSGSVMVP